MTEDDAVPIEQAEEDVVPIEQGQVTEPGQEVLRQRVIRSQRLSCRGPRNLRDRDRRHQTIRESASARAQGGAFILRIEDTDEARSTAESEAVDEAGDEDRTYRVVSLQRRYRDGDEWKTSTNFSLADLPAGYRR